MKKESKQPKRNVRMADLQCCFPQELFQALEKVVHSTGSSLYFVGGTVRDWLLGRKPHDLDLAVDVGAEGFCRHLQQVLQSGTYVQLGTEDEEAARIVWKGLDIDISSFRGGSGTIEEDLALRDFTINSMAVPFAGNLTSAGTVQLIDPVSGKFDLQSGVVRHCAGAFAADPLRLLRTFRFMATLGFELHPETAECIRTRSEAIRSVAAERVRYELDLVMQAEKSADILWRMHELGLLRHLIPELYEGYGVDQPGFHHLDVFHHNFQALREMERLIANGRQVYPPCAAEVENYLERQEAAACLKWSALLHDIGKPAAKGNASHDPDRVTFYGHDETGRKMFDHIARRLKWSNARREWVSALIGMHMHPFHLCTVHREKGLSKRAALKLCNRAGVHLPGLFMLAMSDSLASRGELKPADIEEQLVHLYSEVKTIHEEYIQPALAGPPLIGGRDLIDTLGLVPGPVFSRILSEVQALQVEGALTSREEALAWVSGFMAGEDSEKSVE